MHHTATFLRVDHDITGDVTLHAHVAHAGEALPPGQVTFHGFGASTISANFDPDVTHCKQAWCARLPIEDITQVPRDTKVEAEYDPEGADGWQGSKSNTVRVHTA